MPKKPKLDSIDAHARVNAKVAFKARPDAREVESEMLDRCVSAVQCASVSARDQREANVFRLASMVVRSQFPEFADRLMRSGDRYFASNPSQMVSASDAVRNGWIVGLPRLREMLGRKLDSVR